MRNRRCSRREVSYYLTNPVREEWGGMQQKFLQVVLEEELKTWWRERVQLRKGEALSLFSRDLGLHLDSRGALSSGQQGLV